MACKVTAQSVLEMISKDLECSICTNRFRQPKQLGCLHSFCLQCLQELSESQDPSGTKLTCPVCRREIMLEGSGIADLPNNFQCRALVETVTMLEKLLESQGSEIKCQACNEENQAISRCMDCDHFLCQACQKAHERLTVMKSHKIYSLAQLRSGGTVDMSKLTEDISKCLKHPDQNPNYYFDACERSLGRLTLEEQPQAAAQQSPRPGRSSEKAKLELKTEVKNVCDEPLGRLTQEEESQVAAKQSPRSARSSEKTKWELETEAKNACDESLGGLTLPDQFPTFGEQLRLLPKSESSAETKFKNPSERSLGRFTLEVQLETAAQQSPTPGRSSEKVKWELETEVRNVFDEPLGRLTQEEESQVAAKQSPRPTRSSEKTKWELETEAKYACDESLRGLTLPDQFHTFGEYLRLLPKSESGAKQSPTPRRSSEKAKWELETEVEIPNILSINNVSAFSTNEMLVISGQFGVSYGIFAVLLANSQYEQCLQRLPINGLTNVRCIAASKDDKLLVLDGRVVKVFNKQHQLLHQFTPGMGSGSEPTCLAVDDSHLIAVGYAGKKEKMNERVPCANNFSNKRRISRCINSTSRSSSDRLQEKEISLHNPDGSLIRRLPAPLIGGYLTMYNHRLIYTNYDNQRLVCVDYYGTSVFSEDMTSNMQGDGHPTGVCCDSDGSIYVAVNRFTESDILHYSPNGKYIGRVIQGRGYPYDLTTMPDGNLAVALTYSVKVYRLQTF